MTDHPYNPDSYIKLGLNRLNREGSARQARIIDPNFDQRQALIASVHRKGQVA
ncbi:hypothetical protein [Sphingobium bisphenolivorans]|uniref:hypothetical protein n=1 Tax=Sphingobium bisphenolivorans TaxID=1335760 RepID=UPI0003A0BCFF|nr:hypothetical protein [Sphingobium bisphenolivorans]